MATKHTAILNQAAIDWTAQHRGTLYNNSVFVGKQGNRAISIPGLGKGTWDKVGIELVYFSTADDKYLSVPPGVVNIDEYEIGVWVSLDAKTRGDWLSKEQINHLEVVTDWGGRCYLALELPGCTVEKPLYRLYRVESAADLARVRREWNKVWRLYEAGEIRGVK